MSDHVLVRCALRNHELRGSVPLHRPRAESSSASAVVRSRGCARAREVAALPITCVSVSGAGTFTSLPRPPAARKGHVVRHYGSFRRADRPDDLRDVCLRPKKVLDADMKQFAGLAPSKRRFQS